MEPANKKNNNYSDDSIEQSNDIIYMHTDPYFKSQDGANIMVDCLLTLVRKEYNKCTFYDTYTMVSTFDSSINKNIYVKFNNVTYANIDNLFSLCNNIDPAAVGLYDD